MPFRVDGEPVPLKPDVADHLLRVGQEAITNALRHAKASEICMELTFAEKELHLRVNDDGDGFETDSVTGTEGFGLRGMNERAGIIGAQLAITSQPGSGTTMELVWPL